MADPDDKGRMGGEKNICFPPFGPQFGLKMKERGRGGGEGGSAGASPLDPPLQSFYTKRGLLLKLY